MIKRVLLVGGALGLLAIPVAAQGVDSHKARMGQAGPKVAQNVPGRAGQPHGSGYIPGGQSIYRPTHGTGYIPGGRSVFRPHATGYIPGGQSVYRPHRTGYVPGGAGIYRPGISRRASAGYGYRRSFVGVGYGDGGSYAGYGDAGPSYGYGRSYGSGGAYGYGSSLVSAPARIGYDVASSVGNIGYSALGQPAGYGYNTYQVAQPAPVVRTAYLPVLTYRPIQVISQQPAPAYYAPQPAPCNCTSQQTPPYYNTPSYVAY